VRTRRVAGGRRIAGVGLEQQRRPRAAQEVAREVLRDVDHELHLAARERVVRIVLARDLAHEVEVGAVADRAEQRAPLRAAVGEQHGRGQVLGVGVDRVAEQDELQQRDPDHHPEGHAVAEHLDELLDDHRAEAAGGEDLARAHGEKLSLARSIRWMKTSSSPQRTSSHS
jgi:hypothetical protein